MYIPNICYKYLNMNHKSEIGRIGEDIACKYLKSKKYKIIERNHRRKWGELDIIAFSPDKTLIFVEVKTLVKRIAGFSPEENLSQAKLKKLQRTAQVYANANYQLIDDNKGWQIDLIAIDLTEDYKCGDVRHYENI